LLSFELSLYQSLRLRQSKSQPQRSRGYLCGAVNGEKGASFPAFKAFAACLVNFLFFSVRDFLPDPRRKVNPGIPEEWRENFLKSGRRTFLPGTRRKPPGRSLLFVFLRFPLPFQGPGEIRYPGENGRSRPAALSDAGEPPALPSSWDIPFLPGPGETAFAVVDGWSGEFSSQVPGGNGPTDPPYSAFIQFFFTEKAAKLESTGSVSGRKRGNLKRQRGNFERQIRYFLCICPNFLNQFSPRVWCHLFSRNLGE
jgi:hypothetical protein